MKGCRNTTPTLYAMWLAILSASALLTEPSHPSPLIAPMTVGKTDVEDVIEPSSKIASSITETSIRAPLRHLQGIAAQTFLEQNRQQTNSNRTQDDEAAPRPDIPLSTDSDSLLEGMPPVIPTPGYTPRIIRESGLSGPRLPSFVERPPSLVSSSSSSRIDHKMNERLDEAFGLSGAAPQRGAFERRPGNRFGVHPAVFRDQAPQDTRNDNEWRVGDNGGRGREGDWRASGAEGRIASGLPAVRGPALYNDNAYAMSQAPAQRNYNVPQYDDPMRYGGRYSASPYSKVPDYQESGPLYPSSPEYPVRAEYGARTPSYLAGTSSYQGADYAGRQGSPAAAVPYAKRAPSYQARGYQDSWERAPWGAPY